MKELHYWFLLAILLVVAIIVIFGFATKAISHKHAKADATWIMERYPECCGPQDCEPVSGRAYLDRGEWRVRGLGGSLERSEVKKSIDSRAWACRFLHNNKLRCLFLPEWGSI